MPERTISKARRLEIEREVCDQNEYFIYQCTDKELQKNRVAASRAKAAKNAPGPGVPVEQVKRDLADLQRLKRQEEGDGGRKLDDADKEARAQKVSDKVTKNVTRLSSGPRKKAISKRIDDALTTAGVRGDTRKRARSLAASKSAKKIKSILR